MARKKTEEVEQKNEGSFIKQPTSLQQQILNFYLSKHLAIHHTHTVYLLL